jgi:hypothetical protein
MSGVSDWRAGWRCGIGLHYRDNLQIASFKGSKWKFWLAGEKDRRIATYRVVVLGPIPTAGVIQPVVSVVPCFGSR